MARPRRHDEQGAAGYAGSPRGYPRAARLNALLQEVLAEELERLADTDERLSLLTLTGVSCDPDLRHAVVFLASLPELAHEALQDHRRELQAALAAQVRTRRVPALRFEPDPAIAAADRVEAALRRAHDREATSATPPAPPAPDPRGESR